MGATGVWPVVQEGDSNFSCFFVHQALASTHSFEVIVLQEQGRPKWLVAASR